MIPTANPENVYLGAGSYFFDRLNADGERSGYRELGNAPSGVLAHEIEEAELADNTDGAARILKKVPRRITTTITAQLNEYQPENLALALLGELATITQASDSLTDAPINGGQALQLDRWYDLGGYKNTVTAVKQGAVTLVADTDYLISTDGNMIKLLSSGDGLAAVTTWSGSRPALNYKRVNALEAPRITGYLRFQSAKNQASGPRVQLDAFVSIKPEGELAMISDEFAAFSLLATVEIDPAAVPGAPAYTLIQIP